MEEIKPLTSTGIQTLLDQMNKSLCLIEFEDVKGTGFFCKIPYPDDKSSLPVLITANHILNEKNLKDKNTIPVYLNNKKETKNITLKDRLTYTDKKNDITIIEIKEDVDDIKDFLELDENLFDSKKVDTYNNLSIYLLLYVKEQSNVSFGTINSINKDKGRIFHTCSSGSAGGPIISVLNSKVLGIHLGIDNKKVFKIGTLLDKGITEFQKNKKK